MQVQDANLPQHKVVFRQGDFGALQVFEGVLIEVGVTDGVLAELQPPLDVRVALLLAIRNVEQFRDVFQQYIADALFLKLADEAGIDARKQLVGLMHTLVKMLHALVKFAKLLIREGKQAVAVAGALQEAAGGVGNVFGQRGVAEVVEPVFLRAGGIAAVGVVKSQRACVVGE